MRVFVHSPQFEVAELISEGLSTNRDICIPFFTLEHLIDSIKNSISKPELILIDYLSFNHELFNLKKLFNENDIHIPVCFFNDPCLTTPDRIEHWKVIIEKYNGTNKIDLSYYYPFLRKLFQFIENDKIKVYIPLLSESEKIPIEYIKDQEALKYLRANSIENLEAFKERTGLPNNLYYLLIILYKNKDKYLSYNEIIELYNKDKKDVSYTSLKVMMSNLKQTIRKDPESNFLIYSEDRKFRFIVYRT